MKEGEDRRELEQEEPGGTQAMAITAAHSGADGGRSHGEGSGEGGGRSPRWRRRDEEQGRRGRSGGPRLGRKCRRPRHSFLLHLIAHERTNTYNIVPKSCAPNLLAAAVVLYVNLR